ncbi:hypothetical protein GCM10007874_17800 [Labrys miyagiensis]|uniref:Uncharacterized protein n=1 Tax=Labrys miyagiensis TaxID=346912 RepID=A0ABQ6CES1_9HYPH|nr:hypothetical protein [Labrys miyagiensis]GLS18763.1 hypothetical protein GCM10007874_17800 [Labrys miyagiensis]
MSQQAMTLKETKGTSVSIHTPDEGTMDPLAVSKWSLPMVAAWIIWRKPEAVRAAWPKYLREGNDGNHDFFFPTSNARVSLFDVLEGPAKSSRRDALMQGAAAQRELWRHLDNNELTAVGIPAGENESRAIRKLDDSSEWTEGDDPLFYFDREGWPVDAIGRQFDNQPRYTQVRLQRDDVLRIWKAIGHSPTSSKETTTQQSSLKKRGPKEITINAQKLLSMVDEAQKHWLKNPKLSKTLIARFMAQSRINNKEFREPTLRKFLSGNYKPAKREGITQPVRPKAE